MRTRFKGLKKAVLSATHRRCQTRVQAKSTEAIEDTAKKDQITEKITGATIEVHRILGPGLLESVCEEALCYELELWKMRIEGQKEVDVTYKG